MKKNYSFHCLSLSLNTFSANSTKLVKHTQTIRRQKPTNCLSVFDYFDGLELKGLIYRNQLLSGTYRSSRSQLFFKIGVLKIWQISQKNTVLNSLFNKVEVLQHRLRLQHRYYNTIFYRTPLVAASINSNYEKWNCGIVLMNYKFFHVFHVNIYRSQNKVSLPRNKLVCLVFLIQD